MLKPIKNDLPLRCKCKYELRNLTVMKVVVILVIWVIGLLVIYMAFLTCLEPVLNREVLLAVNFFTPYLVNTAIYH